MAGTTLGFLKFVLGFDSITFKKGMTEAERDLVAFQKKVQAGAAKLAKAGAAMTVGITAPLVAFGVKSIQAAQDAEEMNSAFDVVFGDMSDSVRKWAEETGNAMGRSTQEMQRGALAFQELFGKALDPAKSADMSKTFAVLTQDLASFKNLSNEVAQQKLFSGLAGEAEPLRAVGVFLSEAKVQAAALELGLKGVNGKLTEEEKILARAHVIRKELAKATGDVIRTQDSAANKTKEAAAAFEEMSVTLGTKLLPLKVKLAEVAIKVLDAFNNLSPKAQEFVLIAAGIGAALGPSIVVLGNLINVLAKIGPLMAAIKVATTGMGVAFTASLGPLALFAAAVAAVYLAWKNWDKIKEIVASVYKAVKTWLVDKFQGVVDSVKAKVNSITGFFKDMWTQVVGKSYVPDMVTAIGEHMAKLDTLMVAPTKKATDKVKQAFEELKTSVQGLLDRLFPEQSRLNAFVDDMKTLEEGMKKLGFTSDQVAEAVKRLREELGRESINDNEPRDSIFNEENWNRIRDEVVESVNVTLPKLKELGEQGKATTEEMIEGFGQMAVGTISAVRAMGEAFKSKDILSGIQIFLDLVFNVLQTLGQLGVLKLPGMTTPPYGGARAGGGPVVPGKSYLVGENGPELVTPSRRGFVHPNGEGGQARITIVPSKYFDAVVDNRAHRVATPLAGQAAVMGMAGAEARHFRRSRRSIP